MSALLQSDEAKMYEEVFAYLPDGQYLAASSKGGGGGGERSFKSDPKSLS